MLTLFRPGKLAVLLLAAAVLTGAAVVVSAQAAGQPKNETIEGTLAAVDRDTLAVTLPDGSVKPVRLLPDSLVLGREPATLDTMKPNDAVGVASRRIGRVFDRGLYQHLLPRAVESSAQGHVPDGVR